MIVSAMISTITLTIILIFSPPVSRLSDRRPGSPNRSPKPREVRFPTDKLQFIFPQTQRDTGTHTREPVSCFSYFIYQKKLKSCANCNRKTNITMGVPNVGGLYTDPTNVSYTEVRLAQRKQCSHVLTKTVQ